MLGSGLIKGLGVTARNLVGSFHDPKRYVTTEYPEQKTRLPENYRNFPFLVFDGDKAVDGLRCVACKICENECPPQCIYIIPARDEKGRPAKKPQVFDIDISVCMSCQICVEVCPFDAIKMDQQYEIAQTDRFTGLLLHREQLAKPNSYFHQLHPTDAVEIDARLAELKRAAEEKAKAAAAAKATPAAAPKPATTRPAPAVPAVPDRGPTSPPGAPTPVTTEPAKPKAAEGGRAAGIDPKPQSPAAVTAEAPKPPPAAG